MTPFNAMRLKAASGGDPNFASVVLLCHFDVASPFLDSSSYARTLTTNGGAALDTTNKQFGIGSVTCDGNGDNITAPNSTDFDFGSGDFTVECWVRPTSVSPAALKFIWANRSLTGFDAGIYIFMNTSGIAQLVGASGTGGANIFSFNSSTALTASVWTHVALVRSGTNMGWYQGGVLRGSAASVTGAVGVSDGLCYIGSSSGEAGNRDWNGQIDDLRITKGVARYTSNFTPPIVAFPNF